MSWLDVSALVRSRSNSDFQGLGAASKAIWLSLFEEALPVRPVQDSCNYLMEIQPWELAFLQVRMARGARPNVGVAHVPIRTWDFRYAMGSFAVRAEIGQTLPMPTHVTVIDDKCETAMIVNGLEPSTIVRVEALRFLLHRSIAETASEKRSAVFPGQRVLVFGEYDPLMCAKQLKILRELAPFIGDKYAFRFRPYPAKQILQENLPTGVPLSEVHSGKSPGRIRCGTLQQHEFGVTRCKLER